jgi:hypothetical protein
MRGNDDPDNVGEDEIYLPPKLSEDTYTLPEYLAASGYETYGGFAFNMPFLALSGRFQRHRMYNDAEAETVLNEHLDWVEQYKDDKTFSYLHLSDLHQPTDPPLHYWDRFDVDADVEGLTDWGEFTDD